MAKEYLIEETSLTKMADAVRAITGTTGKLKLDVIETKMAESGEDINEATGLIEQIMEALEGKAAGGGSGGNTDIEDAMVTRTLSAYTNDRVTSIGDCAFAYCSSLTTASFPNCTTIGSSAFEYCSSLTTVSFPNCTAIGSWAFSNCRRLTTVSFPVCTAIGSLAFDNCSSLTIVSFPNCMTINNYAFSGCSSLTTASFPNCITINGWAFLWCTSLTMASFPNCTTIGVYAFSGCSSLTTLTLAKMSTEVCTLAHSNALSGTKIAGGTGYIYVPHAMVSSYKTATNWTYFSSRIFAIVGSEDWEMPEPEMPSFTVNGTVYQFEEGMTWEDWCDSSYNTDGYYCAGMLGSRPVCNPLGMEINAFSDDFIINGKAYNTN